MGSEPAASDSRGLTWGKESNIHAPRLKEKVDSSFAATRKAASSTQSGASVRWPVCTWSGRPTRCASLIASSICEEAAGRVEVALPTPRPTLPMLPPLPAPALP